VNDINSDKISKIDEIDSVLVSKSFFKTEYYIKQRPLLIVNQLTAGQPIWAYRDKLSFLQRFGKVILESPKSASIEDYVMLYMNDETNSSGARLGFISLQLDDFLLLKTPEPFNLCKGGINEEPFKISLGPIGVGKAPLSSHNASWNLLLVGAKRWYFLPPGEAENATEIEKVAFPHSISPKDWIEFVLPKLINAGISVSSLLQRPGDVVFVPHDWMYITIHLADSIDFSQEFCTFLDTVSDHHFDVSFLLNLRFC
jgi:hypothetical protein